jgi:hypothetical protein
VHRYLIKHERDVLAKNSALPVPKKRAKLVVKPAQAITPKMRKLIAKASTYINTKSAA